MKGKMVIISAPSGAGKTTIVRHVMNMIPTLGFSVSATSRIPRVGETDGVDYYFLTSAAFRKKIEAGEFFEWEEVYPDQFYGTLNSEIDRIWNQGKHIIFDVDVMGGRTLKRLSGDSAISLFIMPPSIDELKKRLRLRAKDSEEKIQIRIQKAADEIRYATDFDTIILNDDIELAKEEAISAITKFLNNSSL
jgi:guanylate kinase